MSTTESAGRIEGPRVAVRGPMSWPLDGSAFQVWLIAHTYHHQ